MAFGPPDFMSALLFGAKPSTPLACVLSGKTCDRWLLLTLSSGSHHRSASFDLTAARSEVGPLSSLRSADETPMLAEQMPGGEQVTQQQVARLGLYPGSHWCASRTRRRPRKKSTEQTCSPGMEDPGYGHLARAAGLLTTETPFPSSIPLYLFTFQVTF